jgi:hypothetical protein
MRVGGGAGKNAIDRRGEKDSHCVTFDFWEVQLIGAS